MFHAAAHTVAIRWLMKTKMETITLLTTTMVATATRESDSGKLALAPPPPPPPIQNLFYNLQISEMFHIGGGYNWRAPPPTHTHFCIVPLV